MNILMVGQGQGSFAVRGQQLGRSLGARVVTAPSRDDVQWADLVVLIKRAGRAWASLVHGVGKPIVWDALDFWAQPEQNAFSESESRALLQRELAVIRPTLMMGATEAMAAAGGGVYLPHHAWPGLTPVPARTRVTTVGYQGTRKYLGRWWRIVTDECERRGWVFVVNPPDLRTCDLIVAFRDGRWDGWMCDEWKSGVKIVNAIAAGRPILAQPSAAMRDLQPLGSIVQTPEELSQAFEAWTPQDARHQAVTSRAYEQYTQDAITARYRAVLQRVRKAQAA